MILSTTADPAQGVTVTPQLVTTYEAQSEAPVVVLEPLNGEPAMILPAHGFYRHLANYGTWVLTFGDWETARKALHMLRGAHTETLFLIGDERGTGVAPLEVFPRRIRHRVIPDELDMHEVTVEWIQVGGTY